ncbi:MAG TPA: Rnf-Nqr domain containing protein [Oscillospiraceae bacterium]|nr:Rnf-Nqr domain containing protein [Oscillospiraceae bacterium]
MKNFMQLLFYALLAVTAENVFFAGGIGFSRVLRAARKDKPGLLIYSALLSGFTLVCSLLTEPLNKMLLQNEDLSFIRPAVFAVVVGSVYILVVFICKTWFYKFYQKMDQTFPSAAINSVVLALPFLQNTLKLNIVRTIGFSLGTGVAFFLAVLIFTQAMVKFQISDMPKSFRGLPTIFLYIGILSMAFIGFTGGKL